MTKQTYYVASISQDHWTEIKAVSLRGAKRIADRMYTKTVGGKIIIAKKDEKTGMYIDLAVWSGWYGCWCWIDMP